MEDTRSLLVMVLQKIFHDRPQVIENVYKLIYVYNNGYKEKGQYEKTLKSICKLVNDELPSEILVYLLTLVDVPPTDSDCPLIEKMQKTHNCLPECVRPHLLQCLNVHGKWNKPSNVSTKNKIESKTHESEQKLPDKPKGPIKICKSTQVKSLLDIAATFVLKNEQKLKRMYNNKRNLTWKMIYSNSYKGEALQKCYNVLNDLNKKSKVLRMIEDENITEDIYFEEFKNSDIYLKEKHTQHIVTNDPFQITNELENSVTDFLNNK